jgi:hypothetical protein
LLDRAHFIPHERPVYGPASIVSKGGANGNRTDTPSG